MPESSEIQHHDIARENWHRRVDDGRVHQCDAAKGFGK